MSSVTNTYSIPGFHHDSKKGEFSPQMQDAINEISEVTAQLIKKEALTPPRDRQYTHANRPFWHFTYFSFGPSYPSSISGNYTPSRNQKSKDDALRAIAGIALIIITFVGSWYIGKALQQRESAYKCLLSTDELEVCNGYYNQEVKNFSGLSRRITNIDECTEESYKLSNVVQKSRELFREVERDANINLIIRVGLVAFAALGAIGAIVNAMPLIAIGAIGVFVFTACAIAKEAMNSNAATSRKATLLKEAMFKLNPSNLLLKCEEIVANYGLSDAPVGFASPYASSSFVPVAQSSSPYGQQYAVAVEPSFISSIPSAPLSESFYQSATPH